MIQRYEMSAKSSIKHSSSKTSLQKLIQKGTFKCKTATCNQICQYITEIPSGMLLKKPLRFADTNSI